MKLKKCFRMRRCEIGAVMMGIFFVLPVGCGGEEKDAGSIDEGPNNDGADSEIFTGDNPVQTPVQILQLSDSWHEAWQGSPAVVDIDADGTNEIFAPRDNLMLGWNLAGEVIFSAATDGGRIWASPVIADFLPQQPGLEIAAASRQYVYLWDAAGADAPGFPVQWQDELRAIAADDIDGDGDLEIVVVTTSAISQNDQRDIVMAFHADGTIVSGFPPNTTGAAGCDDHCYVTGGYDQTLALGDVNGDGAADIFVGQDNAYLSLHEGTGRAFDANPMFNDRTKFSGIRFLHDLALAQQGWADDEAVANQAHFTNSAPAIADVDGDGTQDLIILGSVQNAAQTDRERGVALWLLHNDGTRLAGWETPFHAPDFVAGLWDYEGTNVVAAANQVSVADIYPERPGLEFVFAGFDGVIHCVDAARNELWFHTYTTSNRVLTGGVLIADLSADGVPEFIFNTYTPDNDRAGSLVILDASGAEVQRVELPPRGAMPVPTIADVNGDGTMEIVVSLKDAHDEFGQLLVFTVPGSDDSLLLWPTGRGNNLRNGNYSQL